MTDDKPFHERVRRAADSAMLRLVANWAMVVMLPLGGFIGAAIWNKLDKTSDSTVRLEENVKALIERQLPAMSSQIESRFNAQADRITAHDRRFDRVEDRLDRFGVPPAPRATP